MSNKIVTAQKRSLINKIKDKLNLSRRLTESFSDIYKEHMNVIRNLDDSIRQDASTLKDSLSKAKKAYKELRYVDVAYWLGQFNYTISLISAKGKRHLGKLQEEYLNEFLTHTEDAEDLDVDWDKMLQNDAYLSIDASKDELTLIKQAGLLDIFRSDRARAARILQKMYKEQIETRKREIGAFINYADITRAKIIEIFKSLDEARAQGNINQYKILYEKLHKISREFNEKFKSIYEKHLKQLVDFAKKKKQEQEELQKSMEEVSPAVTEEATSLSDIPELVVEDESNKNTLTKSDESNKNTLTKSLPDIPELVVEDKSNKNTLTKSDESNIDPNSKIETEYDLIPNLDSEDEEYTTDINVEENPAQIIENDTKNDTWENDKEKKIDKTKPKYVRGPDGRFTKKQVTSPDEEIGIVDPETGEIIGTTSRIEDLIPKPPAAVQKSKKKRKVKASYEDSIDAAVKKIKYANFYNELEKAASNNDPYIMATMLCKFSEEIDDSDPITSIKLLTLAEEILNA